jgi:hypothetical protein
MVKEKGEIRKALAKIAYRLLCARSTDRFSIDLQRTAAIAKSI